MKLTGGSRRRVVTAQRLLRPMRRALIGIAIGLALTAPPDLRAETKIDARQANGHGRIVLTFKEDLPDYTVTTATGVVILSLGSAEAPDAKRLAATIPNFVAAARRDPDGGALRLALQQPVTVNTMEAGEKLFIDLLPMDWVGVPPGLPADVVAELAQRAKEAEERRRQQEMLEEFLRSNPIELRMTSLPTFTRFVFVWDRPPQATLERSLKQAQILFDRPARIDLSGIKSRLPDYVESISSRLGDTGLEIVLAVDPAAPVRGFREEDTYVVDVSVPPGVETDAAGLHDTVSDMRSIRQAPTAASGGQVDPAGPETEAERGEAEPAEADARDSQPDPIEQAVAPAQAPAEAVSDPDANPEDEPPVLEAAAPDPDVAAATPAEVAADATVTEMMIRPEARRFGEVVKLTLPFDRPTPAALFERAGALWAVFESPHAIDTRLLAETLGSEFGTVDTWRSGAVTILRIGLTKPTLSSLHGDNTAWIITIGDVSFESGEPIGFVREIGSDGQLQVVAAFPTGDAIHEILDPRTGSQIMVVTALGPHRPVPKPHRFVDFVIPQTIHGIAINPVADDLDVRFDGSFVRIAREAGLALSQVHGAYVAGAISASDSARPGFVDQFDDSALDPGAVYRLLAMHVRKVANAGAAEKTRARLQLTRALLATDLGPEALAQLKLVELEDPAAMRMPDTRAQRGIAMVMMQRPEEAIREFNSFGLEQNTDVALWRGIAELQRGHWRAALNALEQGQPAISSYTRGRQRQFRLAAAEAAIEANDISTASVRLAELNEAGLAEDPERDLLNARLMAALGRRGDAIQAFDSLIASDDRRLSAEAELRRAELLRAELDEDGRQEMIERLERLAISWRGDDIELQGLRLLADLYIEQDDYFRAFNVMKSATIADSRSPITRALQDDMNAEFERLFLSGEANKLSSVDALALYYDFRELTPIGRKGDQIIRVLADRLIELDLLDQAAKLLRHQVDHRLKGAGRAQVAAKLAWIYLKNRKPSEAIVILSRTRQAVLPRELSEQRLVLEARALAETGRIELARDLLMSADGANVNSVMSDVLWRGQQWQAAGESFEHGLDSNWDGTSALNDDQRLQVLRSAISYALAEDPLGLNRVRVKFLAGMAESVDSRAFDVVTMPLPETADEFRELIERVAAADTLDAFLEEYRSRYGGLSGKETSGTGTDATAS